MSDQNGPTKPAVISLDGEWRYCPAEECRGGQEDFFRPDYDDSAWKPMAIPGNWFRQGHDQNGTVFFRKKFFVAADGAAGRRWLWFGGVDYHARVWLNGEFLGEHTGYFEHFDFEASGSVRAGAENLLAIAVSSPDDPGFPYRKKFFKGGLGHWDMRPGGWSRQGQDHGSGGVWQSVELRRTGPVRLTRVKAAPRKEGERWTVSLAVELESGTDLAAAVSIRLAPLGFSGAGASLDSPPLQLRRGVNHWTGRLEMASPERWWTWDHGDPRLYRLTAQVLVSGALSDEISDRIGFRTVEWRDDGFYLNSRRVFLKGACYLSNLYLADMSDDRFRQDLELAKNANMNSLRVPYHLEPDRFYELCDESGILVQAEFPMLWDYDTRPESRREAGRQVRAMVDQLHNRPCIHKWVCHCEPTSPSNRRMDRELAAMARAAELTGRRVDPSSRISDHPFFGWYLGSVAGFAALPGGPLPSEFGAQSLPGREATLWKVLAEKSWPPNPAWEYHNFQKELAFHFGRSGTLAEMIERSQQYQARLLAFAIQRFRAGKGEIFGTYLFTFVDAWPGITWAIIDYDRRPKAAYHAVARAYSPLKICLDLLPAAVKNPLLAPYYWNDHFEQGREFAVKIRVVNDQPESHQGVLKWRAAGPGGELFAGEKECAVKGDSAEPIASLVHPLPADLAEGEYALTAELWIAGERRDAETLDFFVTRPGGRRRHALGALAAQARDDLRHVGFFLATYPRSLIAYLAGGYRRSGK